LDSVVDGVAKGFSYPTFSSGLAGLGWGITHLVRQGFLEADLGDILEDLTDPLQHAMMNHMDRGDYDYLHGALGIALYFLEREDLPQRSEILTPLVDLLLDRAEQDGDCGLKWLSLLNKETGLKGYNLSLSHGQASIIDILSRMVAQDCGGKSAPMVLNGAMAYLLKHEIPVADRLDSFFPSWVVNDPGSQKGGRLAWCYGDLGVGQVLYHTGQRQGRKDWEEKGLAMLVHTRLRTDQKEAGIIDVGLCHGAAGVAHIYNRLWQETQDESYAQVARHWFDLILNMAHFTDGPAGYMAYRTPENGGWAAEYGFLEGVAGVGLALLSALYPLSSDWDRALLLS
jgi:hypothetical protein